MEENLGESKLSACSYPYMKQKLTEYFGDKIIETEINGKPNVITFKNKAKAKYTFKRNDQVITLETKSVKSDGIAVQIDTQLLFQRLTLATKATNHIEDVFKYELCSYPPALFDTSLMLRESQKSVLANAIWNLLPQDIPGIPAEVKLVLDGGSLLQRIP